jgi:hypothetical protein
MNMQNSSYLVKEKLLETSRSIQILASQCEGLNSTFDSLCEQMGPIAAETTRLSTAKNNIGIFLVDVEKTNEYFSIPDEINAAIRSGAVLEDDFDMNEMIDRLTFAREFFDGKEMRLEASMIKKIDSVLGDLQRSCVQSLFQLLSTPTCFYQGNFMSTPPKDQSLLDDRWVSQVNSACLNIQKASGSVTHCVEYTRGRLPVVKELLNKLYSQVSLSSNWTAVPYDVPYAIGSHPFANYFQGLEYILHAEFVIWMGVIPNASETNSIRAMVDIWVSIFEDAQKRLEPLLQGTRPVKDRVTAVSEMRGPKSTSIMKESNVFFMRLDILNIFLSREESFRSFCSIDNYAVEKISSMLDAMRTAIVVAGLQSAPVLTLSIDAVISADFGFNHGELCAMRPGTGHVLAFNKVLVSHKKRFKSLLDKASQYGITIPSEVPRTSEDFLVTTIRSLIQALQKNEAGRNRTKEVSARGSSASATSSATNSAPNKLRHHAFEGGEKDATEALAPAAVHLFMMNNLLPIHDFLSSIISEYTVRLGAPIQLSDLERHLFNIYEGEQNLFVTVLTNASGMGEIIKEMKATAPATEGKVLKAKFGQFNACIDVLMTKRGKWRVPNKNGSAPLIQRLLTSIQVPYADFFAAYSKKNFSKKHQDLYVRFFPQDIEQIVQNLFV